MNIVSLTIRKASIHDADTVTNVYLRSRKVLIPDAPLVDSDEAVHNWIKNILIPQDNTKIAIVDDLIVGFVSTSVIDNISWVDQLYLDPDWVGKGIGTKLLHLAIGELSLPIRLYTFQCNKLAVAFYEKYNFKAIAYGDGSGNEEGCPDILFELNQ